LSSPLLASSSLQEPSTFESRTENSLGAWTRPEVAAATPARQPETDSPWRSEVTLFFWGAGLRGDVTVGNQKASFDQSFSDLAESLKYGGGVHGLLQYERWVARVQVDFFGLSADVDKPASGGTLDTDCANIGVGAGYRFDTFFEGWTLEVLGGFRVLLLDNDLQLDGIGRFHRRLDLWDPILGIRPSIPLTFITPKLRLNPAFSVGGGGDSEFIFELQPMLQFALSDRFVLRFGYRVVHYEFEGKKGAELDVDMRGFLLGVGIAF
jgi:hypothetical protein